MLGAVVPALLFACAAAPATTAVPTVFVQPPAVNTAVATTAIPITPPVALAQLPVLTGQHPVELVNQLRKGGYFLYMRHTKTDFSQRDVTSDYDDCSGQRNLTDVGRAQARNMAPALAALSIPIGRVVASPYCRTRETAELAFGRYERSQHYDTIKALSEELFMTPPAAGPNVVVVAHGFIARDGARVVLEEGDVAVLKPTGPKDPGVIARIPAALWLQWADGKDVQPPSVLHTSQTFAIPAGKYAHDVAASADGSVWWTAQSTGELGLFDPRTGTHSMIALGAGSAPHGVIIGPDKAAWVTDGGLNAIVRVDAVTRAVKRFPLPADRASANLNTAAFDKNGMLWFTGQAGVYGRLDPQTAKLEVWDAPKGRGPYGITSAPDGSVYFASLAGSYVAQVDAQTGAASIIGPPTPNQGARRVWADSKSRVWVSEWNSGQLSMYDPVKKSWQAWRLPGPQQPQAYAVYVDAKDGVWVTDFGNNNIVNYAPNRQEWKVYPLSPGASVRQLLGRSVDTWQEIWGAESGANKLVLVRAE